MNYLNGLLNYFPEAPLLFTQIYFWIFFMVVYGVFSIIYQKYPWKNLWLFLASLFFYWKTGGFFVLLLLGLTLFDYNTGIKMSETLDKRRRKKLLLRSIIANLSLLAYFKYAYLITDFINTLLGTGFETVDLLAVTGNSIAGSNLDVSNIVLPVGISFYIFRTISYNVDLYRRKIDPITNFTDFGFYVSFFPTLLAGPIVKSTQFIPQLHGRFNLSRDDFSRAVFLILNGLIKKMVISDYISLNFVDRVFDNPAAFTGFENMMAMFGYSVQIYCDFSGYTDIAIGIALLLGYKLPDNFKSPYKAENIAAFWQRWHISLTAWLREYLFLPVVYHLSNKLKNDRYFHIKTDLILYIYGTMITMLLCGLWHGAGYRFIIWGGIHGLALVIYRIYHLYHKPARKKLSEWSGKYVIAVKSSKHGKIQRLVEQYYKYRGNSDFGDLMAKTRVIVQSRSLRIAATFIFISFTWLFFRTESMASAGVMLGQMTSRFGWSLIPEMIASYWTVLGLMAIALTVHWLPQHIKDRYYDYFATRTLGWQALIATAVVFICYQAKSSGVQPFIYFQF